jgi:glycerophosphoryl diester phosphodiesterase
MLVQGNYRMNLSTQFLLKKSLIFAHRGANKEAAENTRTAFDRALNYAIDGIETDVQLSRDEVAVLWHDRFLNKLSGHESKHIDDYNYAQLSVMNFSEHFGNEVKAEGIMRLQDFIDSYRRRCRLLLEIKNREWEDRARHEIKVRQTLDGIGATFDDAIVVSSFDLNSLIYAQQYRPGFPLVYNLEPEQTFAEAEQVLVAHPFLHGLCLPIASLNEAFAQHLRSQKKMIAVYTCNTDEEINRALRLGVDILISDVPQKALQLRGV